LGKILISISFIILSVAAISFFFMQDDGKLRDKVYATKVPRIILEDFTVYRYEGHKATATLSGKVAHFIEPNILEMFGNIRGMRYNSKAKEHIKADSSSTTFHSRGVVELMKDSRVVKSELEGGVQFGFHDTILFSDFAEYITASEVLRSDMPVVIRSPQGNLKGKSGFRYNVTEELVEVYGPLQGTLQSDGQ